MLFLLECSFWIFCSRLGLNMLDDNDDAVIFCPDSAGLQQLFRVCSQHGLVYDIKYNARKSDIMTVKSKKDTKLSFPDFTLSGSSQVKSVIRNIWDVSSLLTWSTDSVNTIIHTLTNSESSARLFSSLWNHWRLSLYGNGWSFYCYCALLLFCLFLFIMDHICIRLKRFDWLTN